MDKEYLERASLTWSSNSVRLVETASMVAQNSYLYIQEAGYFETRYPYFTERKNLTSYLLVYTISGKGRLRYEGNEYTLTKGSIFLINCLKYHYYESSKEDPWEILWIHYYGVNASIYYEEYIKNNIPITTPEDSFFIESSLRRILSLHQKKDLYRELITSRLIIDILTELILYHVLSEFSPKNIPNYIIMLKQKLNSEFRERIVLDDLAVEFNISKFHLSKEFKKYTGTTINEYLIDRRISQAKELLKYSDLSVSEITYACGLNNISHFINLFKAREGKTPLGFRKEWR